MNDPQLTDLFREQLRDETRTAPGFDELWSKAAVRHRSARVKKFAAALFVIGCIGAAVLALAKKEQPATEQRVVAEAKKSVISAEQNIVAAPPKAVAPAEQPYVPEPENPVVQRPPDSGWERLDELNASIRFLHNRNEADSKRAQVLEALNQPDEASKLRASISKRTAELDESRKAAAELAKTVTGPVKKAGEAILPGENLEIHVQEDASYNGRYVVRRGGYIIMPGIGRVSVAGKATTQAAQDISHALRVTQLKAATVTVERFQGISDESGTVIYLAGEFRSPRPYRIPSGTSPTLTSVLLSSGGWTDRADLTRVKIMRVARNKPVADEVNVKGILEGNLASSAGDITLIEGDVIVLPSGASNVVYVTGRVKRPGSYRIAEGEKLTAYGAVLQSGGFDNFASSARIYVLRVMPDGTKAKIQIDIKAIQGGSKADMILQPNDIMVVPEKWFSW